MMTDTAYPPAPRDLRETAPAAEAGREARYRLSIARVPGGAAALEVHDNERGCPLLGWQGDVARQMLDSGILPADYCRGGCHGCDKSLVRRLIMAGAAAEMRIRAVEDATH